MVKKPIGTYLKDSRIIGPFKGAMVDRGRASYNGMITVDKQAQGTNAYQSNRNLILSPNFI